MKPFPSLAAAIAAFFLLASSAQAQVDAQLQLDFRDPVGTVSGTETIDMWVTLRSVGQDPVTFDQDASEPFGLDASQLPLEGYDNSSNLQAFGSYTSIGLFTSRTCEGTFTQGCSAGPYEFVSPEDGNEWFAIERLFTLAPGDSIDILLYTLKPVGGVAAAGTYQLSHVGLGLTVYGLALDGTTPLQYDVFSANTCSDGSVPGCGFSRTVAAAVPEPDSVAMLLGGLGLVGWVMRRRRLQTTKA